MRRGREGKGRRGHAVRLSAGPAGLYEVGWVAGYYVQCLSPQERTLGPSVSPSLRPRHHRKPGVNVEHGGCTV